MGCDGLALARDRDSREFVRLGRHANQLHITAAVDVTAINRSDFGELFKTNLFERQCRFH